MTKNGRKPINRCGRRRKQCSKCGHRFTKAEYSLLECPECTEPRLCRNKVKVAGAACRFHGGASLKGAEAPAYQGKGYSKYMTTGMLPKFLEFKETTDRLGVNDEISIARAFLADALERAENVDSLQAWKEAQKYYDAAVDAHNRGNRDLFVLNISRLGDVLTDGVNQRKTINEAMATLDVIRRLVDTQRQIYVAEGEFVTRAAALMLVDTILNAIGIHVAPLEGGQNAIKQISNVVGSLLVESNS